jgi:hypothetical protein
VILVLVDDQLVATGPDWMLHHFIADAFERFSGKSLFIQEVK